jgi:hypothetical protein
MNLSNETKNRGLLKISIALKSFHPKLSSKNKTKTSPLVLKLIFMDSQSHQLWVKKGRNYKMTSKKLS